MGWERGGGFWGLEGASPGGAALPTPGLQPRETRSGLRPAALAGETPTWLQPLDCWGLPAVQAGSWPDAGALQGPGTFKTSVAKSTPQRETETRSGRRRGSASAGAAGRTVPPRPAATAHVEHGLPRLDTV